MEFDPAEYFSCCKVKAQAKTFTEQVLNDIDKGLWKIAHKYNINGYTTEDLYQETRLKVIQVIKENKFNAFRDIKSMSFFHIVCNNHLLNLVEMTKAAKRPHIVGLMDQDSEEDNPVVALAVTNFKDSAISALIDDALQDHAGEDIEVDASKIKHISGLF